MGLIEVKGYEVTQGSVESDLGQGFFRLNLGYILELDIGKTDTVSVSNIGRNDAHSLYFLRSKPSENTRYHPVLRARQNGLNPLGSLNYVSIEPRTYVSDKKYLSGLKKRGIVDKTKKSDVIDCNHKAGEFDGFFELVDGSKHNVMCSNTNMLLAAANASTKIKYNGEDATDLVELNFNYKGQPQNGSKIITTSANALFPVYLFGYDIRTGSIKQSKRTNGLYTGEGLLNELTLESRSGFDVKVKEVSINESHKADLMVEITGKLSAFEMEISGGIIFSQIFGVPLYIDDKLLQKPQAPLPIPTDLA